MTNSARGDSVVILFRGGRLPGGINSTRLSGTTTSASTWT